MDCRGCRRGRANILDGLHKSTGNKEAAWIDIVAAEEAADVSLPLRPRLHLGPTVRI